MKTQKAIKTGFDKIPQTVIIGIEDLTGGIYCPVCGKWNYGIGGLIGSSMEIEFGTDGGDIDWEQCTCPNCKSSIVIRKIKEPKPKTEKILSRKAEENKLLKHKV